MAFSSEGKMDQAAAERTAFAAEAKAIPAKETFGYNTAGQIFDIAGRMLDANIARAHHDYKQAAALLDQGRRKPKTR